jgi:hypothetical protein
MEVYMKEMRENPDTAQASPRSILYTGQYRTVSNLTHASTLNVNLKYGVINDYGERAEFNTKQIPVCQVIKAGSFCLRTSGLCIILPAK